ncbi:MAG: hypothetical protein AB7K68_04455 [Bacteriovoracia bacterium]
MRRLAFVFVFLFSSTGFVFAVDHAPCDLSVAGIKDKKELIKFLGKLQTAAAAKDVGALSKLANYPLRVGKKGRIKNESVLKRKFSKVFTPKVLNAIAKLNRDDLFCSYQGVMVGDGEVWIQEIEGVIVISSVNN